MPIRLELRAEDTGELRLFERYKGEIEDAEIRDRRQIYRQGPYPDGCTKQAYYEP